MAVLSVGTWSTVCVDAQHVLNELSFKNFEENLKQLVVTKKYVMLFFHLDPRVVW